MKILQYAGIYKKKASGLSFSIPNLVKGLDKNNVTVNIYNLAATDNEFDQNDYDIIVLNSFFILKYFVVLLKVKPNQKIIICPRGAFSKSNRYDLKKKIYSYVYFSILKLKRVTYKIHFLTNNEMLRSRFRTNNDFVVGNSIEVNSKIQISDEVIKNRFQNKEIVYIGRFSNHIKGLDLLFDFLIKNKEVLAQNKICFKFYGPKSEDKLKLKSIAVKNDLRNVFFYDEIYGEDKSKVLESAYFHVLNSRSEGYPMSVLESTLYSVPQILSVGTNLTDDLVKHAFGLIADSKLIIRLIDLDLFTYQSLCLNAREYAALHEIEIIGAKTLINYKK